ncbi:hypothetical protein [Selenomonas sp. FC4001]|nr:hypothetical protein [Selenomonas sp. FC4001]
MDIPASKSPWIYTHIDEEQNQKVSGWLAGGVNDLLSGRQIH